MILRDSKKWHSGYSTGLATQRVKVQILPGENLFTAFFQPSRGLKKSSE
jgi:hypothetical protein